MIERPPDSAVAARRPFPAAGARARWFLAGCGVSLLLLCLLLTPVSLRAGEVTALPAGGTAIRVKVFDLPDPARTDPFTRAEAAAVKAFRERFPALFEERWRARCEADPARYGRHDLSHVEVELEKFTGITMPGVEVDLLAIAGGLAPDVLYLNFRKSDNYIRSGFLHPLDDPADGFWSALPPEDIERRVHPKLWPVIRRPGESGPPRIWAMPYGGAIGKVLLYRKDRFDEAGLAHPDAAWTWDDLYAAARRLTDPARDRYGLFLTRSRHEAAYFLPFLWSAGGEAMHFDSATGRWACVFDSREAAVALEFYNRLCAERWTDAAGRLRRGCSARDAGDPFVRWQRGEIAMMFDYMEPRTLAQLNPETTGLAPVPRGPDGLRGSELNSRMMALFAGTRDPLVRLAAWEFIRFYDSEEALALKVRVMVEGGMGPFVEPALLRRFGYTEVVRLAPPGWADTYAAALESGRPEPYGRNSNLVYEFMTAPLQRAEQLALADRLPADRAARVAAMQDILGEACRRANAEMIGDIPPRERTLRRVTAAVALLAIVAAFLLALRHSLGFFAPSASATAGTASPAGAVRPPRRPRWRRPETRWIAGLLFPAAAAILVWQYLPLLQGAGMAFFDYRLMGRSLWVGLDNFGDVLFDRYWWASVAGALRYSFWVLALTFLPPVFLAVLLQEIPRGRLVFRTLYYLPAVIAGLVTVVLWKQFLEPTERGVLNALVLRVPAIAFIALGLLLGGGAALFARRFARHRAWLGMGVCLVVAAALACTGLRLAWPILHAPGETWSAVLRELPARLFAGPAEPRRWLADPETALMSCVLPMVWAGIGPGCLIYLAALKSVPEELYEAADLDGAGFADKLLFVVFPTLRALITINFVGAFIGSWYHATGAILVLTGGAAGTEVAGLHIWYKAFTHLKFGPASAMAWMLGFLLIGFTIQQLRMLSRVEFRAAAAAAPRANP